MLTVHLSKVNTIRDNQMVELAEFFGVKHWKDFMMSFTPPSGNLPHGALGRCSHPRFLLQPTYTHSQEIGRRLAGVSGDRRFA